MARASKAPRRDPAWITSRKTDVCAPTRQPVEKPTAELHVTELHVIEVHVIT